LDGVLSYKAHPTLINCKKYAFQTGHQVRLLDTPVAEFLAKRNAGEEGGTGAQAPSRPQTPFDIATIQVRC
jgi:hypothetical protein